MMDRHKATGRIPRVEDIASAAGVHRGTLYKYPEFKAAIQALRSRTLRRGHRDEAGNLEAYDDE